MEAYGIVARALALVVAVAWIACPRAREDEVTLHFQVIAPSGAAIPDAEISIWPAGPTPLGPGPLEPAAAPLAVERSGRDGMVAIAGLDPAVSIVARVRRAGSSPRWIE